MFLSLPCTTSRTCTAETARFAALPCTIPLVFTSVLQARGIDTLRAALIEHAPEGCFDNCLHCR